MGASPRNKKFWCFVRWSVILSGFANPLNDGSGQTAHLKGLKTFQNATDLHPQG
jgi:hypothetical protein